jgi:plastocyanin
MKVHGAPSRRPLVHTSHAAIGGLALVCALLAGCNNFSLVSLLDSPANGSGNPPSTLKLLPTSVNVPVNGTRQFTATGGTGGYSYSVEPLGGSISPSGLYTAPAMPGTYTVIVTDSAGAASESTAQVAFSIPLAIAPTSTTVNAGGTAVFTASGGSGSYSWSKVPADGTLVGGTYTAPWAAETATITVTDTVTSDSRTATVTVVAPTPVQIGPTTVSLNAGSSVAFTAGGATGNPANYSYTLVSGVGSLVGTTYTAPWSAGTATVQVKDLVTNSTSLAAISISAPPPLQINPSSADIIDTGSVTFTATGGSGNPAKYSYALKVGDPGTLVGSTYTPAPGVTATVRVIVMDSLTAQFAQAIVNVTVPVALAISPKTVTLDAGGTVTFSAGGGAGGPYTYAQVSGGGSLVGATYTAPWSTSTATIRATDSASATDDATVTVNAPPPLAINPSSTILNAGQNVSFTATGGSGSYSWVMMTGGGTLAGSVYTAPWTATVATIRLTDALTLQTQDATVTVSAPPPLTITPSTIDVTAGNTVTFTPGGGSGSYSFSVVSGAGTLAGATYTTVTSETADIRLTDNNTLGTIDATVNVYLPLTLVPGTATVQVGGTYPFSVAGGKSPYSFGVSGGGSINSAGVFTALSTGTYTVQVTDALSNNSTAAITVQPPGAWNIVSIDAASKSGQYASLALDGSGLPRIAYYESQAKELRMAAFNGAWTWGTVDTAGRVGQYGSLALMPGTGAPRISYYDITNLQLDYAVWNGSSWSSPQVVDTAGFVGLYTSLALDSGGNPRISYYDQSNNRLKFASWNGSSWKIQSVNAAGSGGKYTSLALDPATGYARISYYDNSHYLQLASWNGTGWVVQTVDSSGDVGMYPSLALEAGTGNPRISYYDHGAKDLKYASWNGSWSIQTLDSTGDVGSHSSLALDLAGRPRISYYDFTNRALKFASWNGSSWSLQTVDSGNNVGMYSSLKLDPVTSAPRIAYYDQTAQDLKFAKQ